MVKEFQPEKVLNLVWEQKKTDHRSPRAQQGYSYGCREGSFRREGSSYFFFVVVLWTLVWRLLFTCSTVSQSCLAFIVIVIS